MATVTQYRPTWQPDEISQTAQLAFRKIFDFIYSQASQAAPLSVSASAVPNAALVVVPDVATQPFGSGIGLLVSLPRAGTWIVTASVSLNIIGDAGQIFYLSLLSGGVPFARKAIGGMSAGDGFLMLSQSWPVTVGNTATQYIVQISKDAGGGTSAVDPNNSSLSAIWSNG